MTHHIIADEQTMIQRWLWQKGGPSLRPDWGALQPLYDQTIARNHRLVRLIATEDQPCSFELDGNPISNDELIAFAEAALGLRLNPMLLGKPSRRRQAAA